MSLSSPERARTVTVSGVGDFVTIARKDRMGENWYLGAVTDEEMRNLNVALSLLTSGKAPSRHLYRDGANADDRANGQDMIIGERSVAGTDVLAVRLAAGRRASNPLRGWSTMRQILFLLLLFVPALAAAQPAGSGPGRLDHYRAFPSRFADPRNVTVWLPPGYDPKGAPYAVLYMHDGQNLFDPRSGYGGKEWGVDEAAAKLIGEGAMRRAIVVGIWNTPKRLRGYGPAKAFDRLPARYIERVRGLYGGTPLSDGYLKFVVRELKPFIDRSYNTSRTRNSTAIMGSSMGGLISLYALTEYREVFGAAGSLSTHWPLLLPTEGQKLSNRDVDAVAAAFSSYLRAALPGPGRHRLYFDHGSETLDKHYAAYQTRIDRLVAARGWTKGNDWISRNFPGHEHNEDSWRARVHIPLNFLLPREGGATP